MRKILRGYVKDKNGNLILIGAIPVPISKDKVLRRLAWRKDTWSGKAQRSLRKKRFIRCIRTFHRPAGPQVPGGCNALRHLSFRLRASKFLRKTSRQKKRRPAELG